ncbi:MAG: SRPBCC family protein [Gammaproteobacteria bacterium]|nr:SRPBCC family protein [Gammaproteobacteria bacterium]
MKVKRSVIIDAPIDRVWAAVRRFDGVVNWNPGVIGAVMESGSPTAVGSIRALDIADGTRFRETLLAHSDIEHFYSYDIIESPLACSNYVSTHRFIEITDGDSTLGIWQGEFDCDPADAAELETIVGDMIYRDAQRGLNLYLKEQQP